MLELIPEQIHLWFVFIDEIRDESLLNRYRRLLTVEEQRQEQCSYFADDRHRYLVTRATVRTVLSRYAPIAPEQWSFFPNTYGRPEITNDNPIAKRISFNISHTQGLIVLAVTCDSALGVDIENVSARRAPLDVADRYFAAEEINALDALQAEMRHERFFQVWTLKESYIKARSMGLAIRLDQFGFHFPQKNKIALSTHPQLNDPPSRWHFWQFRPTADYLAAVCAERSGIAKQQLTLRRFIPLEEEEVIGCALHRESVSIDELA